MGNARTDVMSSNPADGDVVSAREKRSARLSASTDEVTRSTPQPVAERRSTIKTALTMFSLCLATFLTALDVTIITTALPTIAEQFSDPTGFTWIGSSYLLAQAASTLIWGKLSDVFGRKSVLLLANVLFFAGSLVAGFAVSLGMLIVGRTLQGIGGGGIIVLSNICVGDLFSPRTRGIFYGIISGVWAVANSLGPIIGGAFTERSSWRWCFWINLPLDAIAFVVILLFLDVHNPRTPFVQGMLAIDWIGSILVIGATLLFLFGIEFGGVSFPWNSATVICLIVFGVLVFGLFVLWEAKGASRPIMPMRIVRDRSNAASIAACAIHGFVFISGSFYVPFFFQAALGQSPLLSGVYLIALAASLSLASVGTGLFISHTGDYKTPIIVGFILMSLGWGLFIDFDASSSLAKLILYQIVAGLGVGCNIQAPMIALQSGALPQDVGMATSLYGFVRTLATAVSIVVGSVIFQNELLRRADSDPPLAAAIQRSGGSAGAGDVVSIVSSLEPGAIPAAQETIAQSLRPAWIMYTAFAALGIFCWVFIRKNTLSRKHEQIKTGLGNDKARSNAGTAEKTVNDV
ncbi:hypothetical protein AMS68_002764 [Peltaster fructicola]|uniref:Major facilitator superfamily (MFS) profile domain-containing protein n=1 Tax=Peltaster fructicola TaxID=286661 RepID=A0A6H0XR68_9PEZI|nr:hypothetical protein AMS68_002764 [Peltaster fructicola]